MPYDAPIGPTQPNDPISDPISNGSSMDEIISNYFDQARERLKATDPAASLTEALGAIQTQPSPTPYPMPASLHPIGQMAAAFASAMAEQLGARGSIAAHQQNVAKQEASVARTQDANIQRQDLFEQKKAAQELSIRMKINDAKAEQAKQMGDLNEYEARLKAGAMLAREKDKLAQDAKERFMREQEGLILNRVLENTKLQGKNAKDVASYKNMLKVTLSTAKASDALKLWGKLQEKKIYARDLTGEYIYDPAQQDKMAEEVYTEFLDRMHKETGTTAPSDSTKGDAMDSFINSFFEGK